jgi:membrane-associated phospholipid phosphatase
MENLRPVLFFDNMGIEIYRIPGLEYHSHFSFPSGHSATAFALFIGFALFSRNNFLKLAFLIIACIISYSRVYLAQHFLEDILTGSLIGTIVILIVYYSFSRRELPYAEKGLIKFKSHKNE